MIFLDNANQILNTAYPQHSGRIYLSSFSKWLATIALLLGVSLPMQAQFRSTVSDIVIAYSSTTVDDGAVYKYTDPDGFDETLVNEAIQLADNFRGEIKLTAKGGDGGDAKVDCGIGCGNVYSRGGRGRKIKASFMVGPGSGEIPPGSRIKFIVGRRGRNKTGGSSNRAGGGGGGTGILYQAPEATTWELLLVAGGGGGGALITIDACILCISSGGGRSSGKDASSGINGSSGKDSGGGGGANGNGGGGNGGGGGGGITSDGGSASSCPGTGGPKAVIASQAFGGSICSVNGGLVGAFGGTGFGSGGGSYFAAGGGGGGYSGGGGGGSGGWSGGGGGGSFLSVKGTQEENTVENSGDGYVEFQAFPIPDNPPVARCVAEIVVPLDAQGNGTALTVEQVDNGSSDDIGIHGSYISNYGLFSCSDLGNSTVTLTVYDIIGQISTCNTTVKVRDNRPPTVSCKTTTTSISLNPSGYITLSPDQLIASSADNCNVIKTVSPNQFTCNEVGNSVVTVTVRDNANNTSSCNATVKVEDNEAPVAQCQNLTIQLNAVGAVSITTADVNANSTDACGIANLALDNYNFDCSNVGANSVELTVTDNNENENVCTSAITVEDNVAPVAQCQNLTIQLDAAGERSITAAAVNNNSSDACGIANLALDNYDFDCSNVGANSVELTVTDNNENENTCTSTITVEDNVAPVALCSPVTVQLDAAGAGSITTADVNANSTDACGIANLALDNYNFDCSNVGANSIELTVTDNNENENTCTSTITVEDNVAPVALCQNLRVQLDAKGEGSITPIQVDNNSTDACGIAGVTLDNMDFGCDDIGSNVVTLTVGDNNGNENTCTATITVQDNVAPIVVCRPITIDFNGEESISLVAADLFDDAASFDACGEVSIQGISVQEVFCEDIGEEIPITLTAVDPNGNENSCSTVVTIDGLPCNVVQPELGCGEGASTDYDPADGSYTLSSDGCYSYAGEAITFAGQELCGDGEVVVHLVDIDGQGYAGVMMRESLDEGARMVSVSSNLTSRVRSEYRVSTGGNLLRTTKRRSRADWFKIVRVGNRIKGYTSTNGSSWRLLVSVSISNLTDCLHVGLHSYSSNGSATVTADFEDVIFTSYGNNSLAQTTSPIASALQNVAVIRANQWSVNPNPFSTLADINFIVEQKVRGGIVVYNLQGQLVRRLMEAEFETGQHQYTWDGRSDSGQVLDAGVYIVRLQLGDQLINKKVVKMEE